MARSRTEDGAMKRLLKLGRHKRLTRLVAMAASLVIPLVVGMVLFGTTPAHAGVVRQYWIAADEVEWNYAPSGSNQVSGAPFGDDENVFVENVSYNGIFSGDERIGSTYKKVLYREYGPNWTPKPTAARWQHLGTLGPVIQAEVGDTIVVHFRNNATVYGPDGQARKFSIHPHGVFYLKNSEGAPYNDGTSGADKLDDAVGPGEETVYNWDVTSRAGPGPSDGAAAFWMYHSHTDEVRDTNSGLIGPMIVYAQGMSKPDGSGGIMARDIDAEFSNLYTVFDENQSWYIDENIAAYTGMTDEDEIDALKENDDFIESNLMHSINGYVYGNMPLESITMHVNDRVRWYMLAMGTEVDLHTPHWHGASLLWMGMRTDVIEMMPGSMKMLDMRPDNPGIWLYHCHVNDHITAGMITRFQVLPSR
jgi:manganese oxidase